VTHPLIVLTLRPERAVIPMRSLRLALKSLLRSHGLRCVSITLSLGEDSPVLASVERGWDYKSSHSAHNT
jgi:hypothetical protein